MKMSGIFYFQYGISIFSGFVFSKGIFKEAQFVVALIIANAIGILNILRAQKCAILLENYANEISLSIST